MPGLLRQFGAAHQGYMHQDVLAACALVALHSPGTTDTAVLNDVKTHIGDLFDDLTIEGLIPRRCQIKRHSASRPLTAAYFQTDSSIFPIREALISYVNDPVRASEYRLITTLEYPDPELSALLVEDANVPPCTPDLPTRRLRLSADAIWPEDSVPAWLALKDADRSEFVEFCDVFVIETGCPRSSLDLRKPGELERHLIFLLESRLGIGHFPNASRDLADAAAHMIHLATSARADKQPRRSEHVATALALTTDFGRVSEHLPVDAALLVSLPDALQDVVDHSADSRMVVVRGVPGAGKSWLLEALRHHLLEQGHLVATHYCFVDLLDPDRDRRSTIDVVFGSLIAELYDLDPDLVCTDVPRYAAGPRELGIILTTAQKIRPELQVTLIVDGLDHADRLSRPGRQLARDIAQELAELDLPDGVRLIIGSQAGDHLAPLLTMADTYEMRPWSDEHIRGLAAQAGIGEDGRLNQHAADTTEVQEAIVNKARGNPLYATYLSRMALSVGRGDISLGTDVGIAQYLLRAPELDDDLSAYYGWLFDAAAADTGAATVVKALALAGFPLTAAELAEIFPLLTGIIPTVLSQLAPVLSDTPDRRQIRIYHESFQRFVQARADEEPNRDAILLPVRDWLDARGFFSDLRAFRWLFSVLRAARLDAEILERCGPDFVANAAAHCQPGDAVMANLSAAAQAATRLNMFADLTRIVELNRAADYLYHWRLNDDELAKLYGRAFATLHGTGPLISRLLHDGRLTFHPRVGLVLCHLSDQAESDVPWPEYLTALKRLRATDDITYIDGEENVENARVAGELRLAGRTRVPELVQSWLSGETEAQVHPFAVAQVYVQLFGPSTLLELAGRLEPGASRGWVRLAAARSITDSALAAQVATEALQDGLDDTHGIRLALQLGADPGVLAPRTGIDDLTVAVNSEDASLRHSALAEWLTELDIAVAVGDETTLSRVEDFLGGAGWYRRWLRFALRTRRRPQAPDVLDALRDLSTNIDKFSGNPTVARLYFAYDEIRESFRDVLAVMDDELYPQAADLLFALSDDVDPWPGAGSGPLPLAEVLDALLATADTSVKREAASKLSAARLAPEKRVGGLYDRHAYDQFVLTMLHARAGLHELAQDAWREGCMYLAAYGHRKDITVFEIIDSLRALGEADSTRVAACLVAAQPLAEAVVVHTDGRSTHHAVNAWADHATSFHPARGLLHVAQHALLPDPTTKALDHAMASGAATLRGVVTDEVLQAFWVALGSLAITEAEAALRACEVPTEHSLEAWRLVKSSLLDNTSELNQDTVDLVASSAARIGQPWQAPTVAQPEEKPATGSNSAAAQTSAEFVLDAGASAAQVAHAVRRWRADSDPSGVNHVVEAVLARLSEINAEDGTEATWLLHRIGADTLVFSDNQFLSKLAENLEKRGMSQLAAVAFTLAYTRSRDGWRRFAGPDGQGLFLHALMLDQETAWDTLIGEVAESVGPGAEYGITAHFLELLAAGGRVDEAFACWAAACAVIAYRLPSVGPSDYPRVNYDATATDLLTSLAACLVARLESIEGRETALEGIALLVRHGSDQASRVIAHTLAFAVEHASKPALEGLLRTIRKFDTAPFVIARYAAKPLADLAASDMRFVSALARTLVSQVTSDDPPPQLP